MRQQTQLRFYYASSLRASLTFFGSFSLHSFQLNFFLFVFKLSVQMCTTHCNSVAVVEIVCVCATCTSILLFTKKKLNAIYKLNVYCIEHNRAPVVYLCISFARSLLPFDHALYSLSFVRCFYFAGCH